MRDMNIQLNAPETELACTKITSHFFAKINVIGFIATILVALLYFVSYVDVAYANEGTDTITRAGELFEMGNQVWFDTNGNGLFDAVEQGVPNVQITLLDVFGNPYDIDPTLAGIQGVTTITDDDGEYLFTNLITDTYRIGIDAINFQPDGPLEQHTPVAPSSITPDDNVDNDNNGIQIGSLSANGLFSGPINLNTTNSPTFINNTVDFGFYTLTIGNFVWEDINNNGLFDQREAGLPNIVVNLLDSTDTAIDNTQTDSSGLYTFTAVISGTYRIEVLPPIGYSSSTGGGEELSPDSNGDNNDNGLNLFIGGAIQSAPFQVTPGDLGTSTNNVLQDETGVTIYPTIDFGLWKYTNIGHIIWQDINNNGIVDPNEPGIDGVSVDLYLDDGNGVLDITADTLLNSMLTVNGGYYGFEQLVPADYFIYIPIPPNAYPSSSTPIRFDDVGIQQTNGSPVTSGLITLESDPNVEFTSGSNGTSSELSINFGFFAPASIGDMVWYDYEQDGLQVARDDGVPSVDVILYDSSNNVVAAMTTNSAGQYRFDNIIPGNYYIIFIPPNGYEISPQDVGSNDELDSDADPISGVTPTFMVDSGSNLEDLDLGIYIPTQLGDYTWLDIDGDGILGTDPAELPLANVLVEVFDTSGNLITQTTTITTGQYSIIGLAPRDYIVKFTPPGGLIPVSPDQGSDDTIDSDISITDFTVATTLTSGENERKIDAGFIDPSLTQRASFGGWVWFDADGDGIRGTDPTETPLSGIRIRLFDATDALVAESATDGIGFYQFDDLSPGDYYAEFESSNSQVFVPPNTGGDDTTDSDIDPNTAVTPLISLRSGEVNISIGAGLYSTASIGDYVWHDTNADGIQGPPEDEEPFADIVVFLYNGDGGLVAQTTTDANGLYEFANLIPGEYYLEVAPPPEYIIITPDQTDEQNDSDADSATGQTPVTILLPAENDTSWDFGLLTPAEFRNPDQGGNPDGTPNAINLTSFTVQDGPSGSGTMIIQWETSAEIDTLGYYILRSRDSGFRSARTLSSYMTPSLGIQGGDYELTIPYNSIVDPPLSSFTFWLVEIEVDGNMNHFQATTLEGQSVEERFELFLPLLNR